MNRHEKIAWFNLAVISVSILLFIVFFFLARESFPVGQSLKISFSAFAVCGLLGLSQTLFRKEDGAVSGARMFDPDLDERDIRIYQRAALHAFAVFWVVFVFLAEGVWIYFRFFKKVGGTVIVPFDLDFLPLMIFPFFVLLVLVYTISVIIQHRRGVWGDESLQGGFVPNRRAYYYSLFFMLIFLLVGAFSIMKGQFLFGLEFITITTGSTSMTLRELRRKQGFSGDEKELLGYARSSRIFNALFTVLYVLLTVVLIGSFVTDNVLRWPSFLIFLFIGLIFYLTVIADMKLYIREHRHEQG